VVYIGLSRGFVIIEKLNTPGAAVVALAFVIVINGFVLFYRYGDQQSLPSGENIGTATPAGNTAFEIETQAKSVHRAGSRNIVTSNPYIDDSLSNENPEAILLAKRTSQSGVSADDLPIGVWYNANQGKWAVFYQALSPMNRREAFYQPLSPMSRDEGFNINIVSEPGEFVFFHRATYDNTVDNETYIDHRSTNENPDAILTVTPNFNPGGGAGTINNHPFGTRYDTDSEKWVILNTDLELMPHGAAFNVGTI
jgi:hypothetical protein